MKIGRMIALDCTGVLAVIAMMAKALRHQTPGAMGSGTAHSMILKLHAGF
jgi:hypothetical protein